MCGLTGLWQSPSADAKKLTSIVGDMTTTIAHRGPDDSGVWIDASHGIGLGFRRLAILDLSPMGHQPMQSHGGRYWMVFNGEIYNFKELRCELEAGGHDFRSGSDTEVILEGAEQWGIEKTISKLNGMFAIAIWDAREKTLTLARDHFGIKPMYYGWWNGTLLFGSELKSLRAFPGCRPDIDRGALTLYIRHGCVPGPWSIYKDVYKLQPGCMVTFQSPSDRQEPKAFWSLLKVANDSLANPYRGSIDEATDDLDVLLQDVIARQMMSDVPLGAFLSGGIDSSLVVSLMQSHSARPVKTFCIGFSEQGYDESPFAKQIANHLGTDHTEMFVTHQDARDLIPRLPHIYDEPFADASAIPTTLLSILTRKHVTVSLSGDGGDEMFAGYVQHWESDVRLAKIKKILPALRGPLGTGLGTIGALMGDSNQGRTFRSRAQLLRCKTDWDYINLWVGTWKDASRVVKGGFEPSITGWRTDAMPNIDNLDAKHQYIDSVFGLPDDMLTKVDRASSSTGLEARVPLLDPRVAEFAWRLPWEMKVARPNYGKAVLRNVLKKYVPAEMFERPKQGFSVPIAAWLRGPLRDWCEHMIDEKRLREEGFFEPGPIRKQWEIVQQSNRDWEKALWIILVFQAWQEAANPGS